MVLTGISNKLERKSTDCMSCGYNSGNMASFPAMLLPRFNPNDDAMSPSELELMLDVSGANSTVQV